MASVEESLKKLGELGARSAQLAKELADVAESAQQVAQEVASGIQARRYEAQAAQKTAGGTRRFDPLNVTEEDKVRAFVDRLRQRFNTPFTPQQANSALSLSTRSVATYLAKALQARLLVQPSYGAYFFSS